MRKKVMSLVALCLSCLPNDGFNHGCKYRKTSCSKRRSKPHFGAVELAHFSVAEEDAMYVFIHLFEADLLVAEHFADEHPALMPTDVPAVVHPPKLERSGILEARYPAGE